jgi:hypothetical protein
MTDLEYRLINFSCIGSKQYCFARIGWMECQNQSLDYFDI